MSIVKFKFAAIFSLIILQAHWLSAEQPLKIVTYEGIAKYADRFEFLPSNDCKSFEMRSWGRILDKESNALSINDIVSLNLHSGPFNIAQFARVLSISKQIVETHGGRISAENRISEKGEVLGARFTIQLPVAA